MFEKWKLGSAAYNVVTWTRDVIASIDPDAALRIAFKVLEIERERRGTAGALKLVELLDWFKANYPHIGAISIVSGYANALVALLKALGVFKARGKV